MAPEIYLRLERYQDHGWQWSESYEDLGRTVTGRYRTNPDGAGKWAYLATGERYADGTMVYEYKQIAGTTQFWLPQAHRRAYDKIRNAILTMRR